MRWSRGARARMAIVALLLLYPLTVVLLSERASSSRASEPSSASQARSTGVPAGRTGRAGMAAAAVPQFVQDDKQGEHDTVHDEPVKARTPQLPADVPRAESEDVTPVVVSLEPPSPRSIVSSLTVRGAAVREPAADAVHTRLAGALTRELLKAAFARAGERPSGKFPVATVSFANWVMRDLALNLARMAADAAIGPMVLVALDEPTFDWLAAHTPPETVVAWVAANVTAIDKDLGRTQPFNDLLRFRLSKLREVLSWDYAVFAIDVDVALIRSPLSWFAEHAEEADVLISVDTLHSTATDADLELELVQMVPPYCAGVIFMSPTPAGKRFTDEWLGRLEADPTKLDQAAMMELLQDNFKPSSQPARVHTYGFVRVGTLPLLFFCSGHVFFTQRLPQRLGLKPFVAHATFQFGFAAGKRNAMREHMLWHDPAEYYDGGVGFLTMQLDIPRSALDYEYVAHGARPDRHYALAYAQSRQVVTALAIANATGRVLIMPQFMALCDKHWYQMEDCRATGAVALALPFIAPMDHIMAPDEMADDGVIWRESSFLRNPKVPDRVLLSRLAVRRHALRRAVGALEVEDTLVLPRASGSDVDWRDWLAPYRGVRVIDLGAVDGAFTGFANPQTNDWFNTAMREWVDFWCCGGPKWYERLIEDSVRFG